MAWLGVFSPIQARSDGRLRRELGASGAFGGTSENLFLGRRNDGFNFGGQLDDVRIYDRALTVAEIEKLANGTHPATGAGTYTLQDTLDIDGSLTINSGTLDTGTNQQINLFKNWENNGGIFIPNSGTVLLDGTSGGPYTIQGGGQDFYRIQPSTATGTWNLVQDVAMVHLYIQNDLSSIL